MGKKIRIIGLILFFTYGISTADSWGPCKIKVYHSENNKYKLIVTPRFVPDKYFEWDSFRKRAEIYNKAIDRKRAKFFKSLEEKDTVIIPCSGKLILIEGTDTTLVWERKLLNEISPVSAIVANDGSSVVTFDNWFSYGYGKNVMVVYNEKGDAKRTYSLSDISPYALNDYFTSVSSIWWRAGAKYIDNDRFGIEFHTELKDTTTRIYNAKLFEFEK